MSCGVTRRKKMMLTHIVSSGSWYCSSTTIIMIVSAAKALVSLMLLASVCALVPPLRPIPSTAMDFTLLYQPALNEVDEMCIENVADLCTRADAVLSQNECDLDENEALINQLTNQRELLMRRVDVIDQYLSRLRNADNDRTVEEGQYIPG
jgi:hypothetical protein